MSTQQNPRRIVMVTNGVAPDQLGGLERYVRELSAALVRRDVDVVVLAKQVNKDHPTREMGQDGVQIIRHAVPSKKNPAFGVLYPVAVSSQVRSELRQSRGAIVHAHFPVAALPLRLMRGKYFYTFHSPVYKELLDEHHGTYRLPAALATTAVAGLKAAERTAIRGSTRVSLLSEYSRRELALLAPRHAYDAALIPGGIDTGFFDEGPSVRDAWAAEAEPLLFTARRLTTRTGVFELISAMKLVLQRFPRARLAIAGSGHLESQLRQQIADDGMADSIRFLGRLWDEDLRNAYRAADLTIMPTQNLEGFGLTTAECLATGTPVLGTSVGATPEILRPLHSSLVADGKSAQAIADAAINLLEQPQLLKEIRLRARGRIHPQMGWDSIAQQYLDFYRGGRTGR